MKIEHLPLSFAYMIIPETETPILEDIPSGLTVQKGQEATHSYATDDGIVEIKGTIYEFFGPLSTLSQLKELFEEHYLFGFSY